VNKWVQRRGKSVMPMLSPRRQRILTQMFVSLDANGLGPAGSAPFARRATLPRRRAA
jgi:hypothetical protein